MCGITQYVALLGKDLISTFQQCYSEFVGLEQGVQFFSQVNGVTRITKTSLFIFGTRVIYKNITGLQINRLLVIKHSPDAFALEYLFTLVIGFVYVFY
jgi:hypothetical protein